MIGLAIALGLLSPNAPCALKAGPLVDNHKVAEAIGRAIVDDMIGIIHPDYEFEIIPDPKSGDYWRVAASPRGRVVQGCTCAPGREFR